MRIPMVVRPYGQTQLIKEIPFPPGIRFGQILILGPPGVGKSTMMRQLGGWMEEGHLDLAHPQWWRSRTLAFTPRELHLYLPFQGMSDSVAVYDADWLARPLPLDFPRIRIPTTRDTLFALNWKQKFVFEFLLPPPEQVLAWRQQRAGQGSHPVDAGVSLVHIQQQLLVFWNVAKHLHRCGLLVHLRQGVDGPPLEIVDTMDPAVG